MKKRGRKADPTIRKFNNKDFRPFIRAIGLSTLLWNDLHEFLAVIFCVASGASDNRTHWLIWNAIPNDRNKREMLLAAAKSTFVDLVTIRRSLAFKEDQAELKLQVYERIKWLCEECKKVEDDRNNAIHAPLTYSYASFQVYPETMYGNPRAKNLEGKHLLQEYQRLRKTIEILRQYAHDLFGAICSVRIAQFHALPDRPKLPDRGGAKKSLPRHSLAKAHHLRRP
jgi:hypothetical protein